MIDWWPGLSILGWVYLYTEVFGTRGIDTGNPPCTDTSALVLSRSICRARLKYDLIRTPTPDQDKSRSNPSHIPLTPDPTRLKAPLLRTIPIRIGLSQLPNTQTRTIRPWRPERRICLGNIATSASRL